MHDDFYDTLRWHMHNQSMHAQQQRIHERMRERARARRRHDEYMRQKAEHEEKQKKAGKIDFDNMKRAEVVDPPRTVTDGRST